MSRSALVTMGKFSAVLVLAGALTALCHHRTLSRRDRFPAEEDILYLPKSSALKVMSLGHHELAATLVFVRALVYFGGELGTKDRRFTWLENYMDTMVSLDPQFEMAYKWAGSAFMYNGRTITNDMVERSNHFLERGIKHFPRSWQLPWMLGCNYLFEMRTTDPKQKKEWERIGGEWIRQAALIGSAPPWASLLAAQLMKKEGRDEVSMRYLEEVYLTTSDEKTKQEIRNRILFLKSKVEADRLERLGKDFNDRWEKTLPYAPPDLFVALGDPPSARMDPEFLARDEVLIESQRSEDEMHKDR
jgi:hypothetical protein